MSHGPITIKQYANRRLYNADEGRYVTLQELGVLVEDDKDFVAYDACSGAEITPFILRQIILERGRHG